MTVAHLFALGEVISESGATAVEYAIMLAAIAAAIILVAFAVGEQLPPIFQSVLDGFP